MESIKNGNSNNNNIVNSLEYMLQILYNFYYKVKVVFKDNWLFSGILISIIGLSGLIYYFSLKNPNNIMDYIQTPSTILYVFLTTLLISLYFYFSINSNQTEILKPVIKYLKLIGIILGVYILISFFYFISKQIMYYGSKESVFGTVFVIICIMGILYNTLIKHTTVRKSNTKYEMYDLLIDIIFYIPCLFINLIDYVKEDYDNTPSSTFILTGIVLCIILFFYGLPYILNILKHDKGIKLLKEQTELNKSVVFVSQQELRQRIIQNRPLLERQMLHATNKIENQYKTYGKYFNTQAQIFDISSLYNNKKYLSNYGIYSPLVDHPKCVNSSIKCDSSDNLLKCNGQRLEDTYNMYQTCDNRQSLFNSLFLNPKESVKIYPDSSKDKLLTLQEMCNIDEDVSSFDTSVMCISYNDVSNQVINQSDDLINKQIYACNVIYNEISEQNNRNEKIEDYIQTEIDEIERSIQTNNGYISDNDATIVELELQKTNKESQYNTLETELSKKLYQRWNDLRKPNGGVVDTLKKIGTWLNISHYNDRSSSLKRYMRIVKQDVTDISNDIYSYKEILETYTIGSMRRHLTKLGEIKTSLENKLRTSNALSAGDLNKFTDVQKERIEYAIDYLGIAYDKFNTAIDDNPNLGTLDSEIQDLATEIQILKNGNQDLEIENQQLNSDIYNITTERDSYISSIRADKYKVIYGYNDVDDGSGPINCIIPKVYEGFEGTMHTLDSLISDKNLFGEFSNAELSIINRAIKSEESNLKIIVDKFKEDPQKLKEYIIAFFASNDNFMTLMDYINKYNNETNIFLDQNLSNLIKKVNLRANIHEYNYHYGISFWIYFDSSILNMNSNSDTNHGLIMNYANQPRIYYDFNTSELKIDVLRDESNKQQPNYKTKNILYQRWNHFVINYNYGVLDIFINNNLVGTINKLNPYVGKKNNIVFGSSTETLHNCGICNVNYYELPLKLSKIKEMYKNHENPCI